MHTSTVLQSSDFRYWRIEQDVSVTADFASLFPDYHELDRVGVVSLSLEDGIRQAGSVLLALTTAFYDTQRAKGEPFFNYPQHFALLGGSRGKIQTRSGAVPLSADVIGPFWGNLDVWPESNWHLAPATVEGMLRKVFDLQINRLFWPEGFLPELPSTRLPDYMWRILRSRLKAVYHYDAAAPTMKIEGTPKAARIVEQSLRALPAGSGELRETLPGVERFRQVSASEFLETMTCCFEQD
jgi:hypothetical protein